MNLRLLIVSIIVVAGIAGAGWHFGQERQALQSEAYQGGPLLPGADARINDVDAIRLESQEGGVLNFARQDGQWVIPDHYGYRAHQDRVAILLKQTASLEKIEPKTAKPENHARVHLDDPAGDGAEGTRVTFNAGEETVADIIVGLNRPPAHGGGAFVRQWGDDQTWLTEGEFRPRRRLLEWLDRNVIDIDGRRIRSALIQHPAREANADGAAAEIIVVSKQAPDEPDYALAAAVPEGYQAKADHELSTIARIADFLVLEDVKPASELEFDQPSVAVHDTFDGLRLTFRAQEQADGKIWTTIAVDAIERADGLDAFIESNKGQDSEAGRIADQFKAPEEITAEIAKWSAWTEGWAYRLTDYKSGRLTPKTEDVVQAPEDAARTGAAPRQ